MTKPQLNTSSRMARTLARLFDVAIAYVPDADLDQQQELVDAAIAVGNEFHASAIRAEKRIKEGAHRATEIMKEGDAID